MQKDDQSHTGLQRQRPTRGHETTAEADVLKRSPRGRFFIFLPVLDAAIAIEAGHPAAIFLDSRLHLRLLGRGPRILICSALQVQLCQLLIGFEGAQAYLPLPRSIRLANPHHLKADLILLVLEGDDLAGSNARKTVNSCTFCAQIKSADRLPEILAG